MGHQYQAVQWNGNKVVYDLFVLASIVAFIAIFMIVGLQPHSSGHTADPVVLMIRALGTTAFMMLTIVLSIGPLARLSRRFVPMLYNRRHLGVLTFLVASAHFGLALLWYHGGGGLNPLVSLFVSNQPGDPFPGLPFELFGLAALVILFLMAATSHDFWLNNLSAPVWKALHMGVYVAYGALLLHVAYGALITERVSLYPPLAIGGFAIVALLHIVTGVREWGRDNGMKRTQSKASTEWVRIGPWADIPDQRAVIAPLPKGDRVAVFRDDQKVFAVQNACRHQNGPLGEGCLKDGLVTCPWHGWQYRPDDGVSPPPFTEKISTFDVKLEDGIVFVSTKPNEPGTKGVSVMVGASREESAA
ncbi:MAG: Rieske 2Fe-2S domain-containing protein [Pseudomonadota bacterium]